MALYKSNSNISIKELRTLARKQLAFKQYTHAIVVTKFPDMDRITASIKQKEKRDQFKEAVAYAQAVLKDPTRKETYQKIVPAGQKIYHFALREYLRAI